MNIENIENYLALNYYKSLQDYLINQLYPFGVLVKYSIDLKIV